MRREALSSVVLFAAAMLSAGCSSSSTAPERRLALARTQWETRGPKSYSMVVSVSCECVPGAGGSVRVTVRNRVVESRRYINGGDVPPERAAGFPTVDEMFAMIDDALKQGIKPFELRYAPLGYPTRFAIGDPAADSPLYVVTDFHEL